MVGPFYWKYTCVSPRPNELEWVLINGVPVRSSAMRPLWTPQAYACGKYAVSTLFLERDDQESTWLADGVTYVIHI